MQASMMKIGRILSIAILAVFLTGASDLKTRSSAEKEQRDTKSALVYTKDDVSVSKGIEDPLNIKGDITTRKPTEEIVNDAKEHAEKVMLDREIVTYAKYSVAITVGMLIIAVLQVLLFWKQLAIMDGTMRVSQDAASAALRQAAAVIGIELPVIRILTTELIDLDEPIPENSPYSGVAVVEIPSLYAGIGFMELQNHGRTPAFPVLLETGYTVASQLPDEPVYNHGAQLPHSAVIHPNGGSFTADIHRTLIFTDDQIAAMKAGTALLWFFGRLTYDDFMGEERYTKFCWRWARRNTADAMMYFASDGNPPGAYLNRHQR